MAANAAGDAVTGSEFRLPVPAAPGRSQAMSEPLARIRPGMFPTWFLGDASTLAEKIAYLRACHAGGIAGLVLACSPGNQIPYLSADWFGMIQGLVEEGERLDMQLWLYDEDPVPSGGASGLVMLENPALYATAMRCHEKPAEVRPNELWFIGEKRVLWAGLVPTAADGAVQDLTDQVGTVSQDWFMLKWDSRHYYADMPIFTHTRGDAVWQRFALRTPQIPAGYRLLAITAEGNRHYRWPGVPDLLHPESFVRFRRLVLERYAAVVGRHFGKTIPGVFTDEAKPGEAWTPFTPDLFSSFQTSYGYDLRPRLHQLFGEPTSRGAMQTRIDYQRWVAERFLERFVSPYREWCEARNLLLIGHLSPEDDPFWEVACGLDMLATMKSISLPGTDLIIPHTGLHLGSLRAGSVRSQTGRPYAISESLALSGWDVTTDRCRQILAAQMTLGIDRFSVHAFFSSSEGIQTCQVPPEFGPGSSIFPGICVLNDWLADSAGRTDGAQDVVDVAIVDSIAAYRTAAAGESARNTVLKARRQALWAAIRSCLRAHVGIHMVGAADLAEARIEAGRIRVGACSYRAVLVPPLDILPGGTLATLSAAVAAGVPVHWFGQLPTWILDGDTRLQPAPAPAGTRSRVAAPSAAWCRAHLPRLVRLVGGNREDCQVRRFVSRDGQDYLLAVNLGEDESSLRLDADAGRVWTPERVDGATALSHRGTTWQAPGRGCGLFRLAPRADSAPPAVLTTTRAAGHRRRLIRLGPNLLRLNRPTVSRPGSEARLLDFPQPYWKLFQDYTVTAPHNAYSFAGEALPVQSTVPRSDLRYTYTFAVAGRIGTPVLVLDPRCARGRFRLELNGSAMGPWRRWPLPGITPARIRLAGLTQGTHTLEIRFEIANAMEGLLSQPYIEGRFDVDLSAAPAVLRPPTGQVSDRGWQACGLPHYMGACTYSWVESFRAAELTQSWHLRCARIVDSAELRVNGRSQGRRAWAPWEWALNGLQEGRNRFELTVHGTAGNKHELDWPNQPQGWIGAATLYAERV